MSLLGTDERDGVSFFLLVWFGLVLGAWFWHWGVSLFLISFVLCSLFYLLEYLLGVGGITGIRVHVHFFRGSVFI